MKKEFPKQIFVAVENEGTEDEFLITYDTPEAVAEIGETRKVAIYDLQREVEVTTEVKVK